jgi:hypothetical protein
MVGGAKQHRGLQFVIVPSSAIPAMESIILCGQSRSIPGKISTVPHLIPHSLGRAMKYFSTRGGSEFFIFEKVNWSCNWFTLFIIPTVRLGPSRLLVLHLTAGHTSQNTYPRCPRTGRRTRSHTPFSTFPWPFSRCIFPQTSLNGRAPHAGVRSYGAFWHQQHRARPATKPASSLYKNPYLGELQIICLDYLSAMFDS